MIEREGGKRSISNDAEGVSKDSFVNKGEYVPTTSPDVTLEPLGSIGNSKESANSSQNVAEKKREEKGHVKPTSFTHAVMQSDTEVAKNEYEGTTDEDTYKTIPDSNATAVSAKKSKKKKSKGRGKSAPDTSRTDPLSSVEYEGCKPECSNRILDSTDMRKAIRHRIAEIESGTNQPQSINYNCVSIKTVKKEIAISSSKTIKTVESPGNISASVNAPQNMAEKIMDNMKSTCTTRTAMQSQKKERKNGNEKKVNEDIDFLYNYNQQMSVSGGKSKNKRRKKRGKSVTGTLGKESTGRTEFEGHKLNSSDKFLDKDAAMRKSFSAGISALETLMTQPKSINYMRDHETSHSLNTGDEVQNSSTDNQIDYFIRPVIFMADKSTQTDPLLEPQIFKPTDEKNKSDINLESDSKMMGEAAESDLPDPLEEGNKENIPENTDIWEESGFYLRSIDRDLQSFREDLMTDLELASKKFKDNFIKCLKKGT